MTAIRIMTYNVRGCRSSDGRLDVDPVVTVIGDGAPDIVALQDLDPESRPDQLQVLAERLGMHPFSNPGSARCAFLSYYPLSGLQAIALDGGDCLRADADLGGKRLHLFNLRLSVDPQHRRRQITRLLGPDVLASNRLPCPALILGDFGDFWWGAGNIDLALMLRKVRRPLWSGTYPARFPVAGRDRAYLLGDLRVLEATILRSSAARTASSHLPLILTVKTSDPRNYLRLEKLKPGRMEIAPG